tara:strand:+ start:236 stop:574 length:339 start_codon:yes stop_codon:yes gene_type:complete
MTTQFGVDFEIVFQGIEAVRQGAVDEQYIVLPCGLGLKPLRLQDGRLSRDFELIVLHEGRETALPYFIEIGANGEVSWPELPISNLVEADREIVRRLAKNVSQLRKPILPAG